jgi:hypothetical protein
LRNWNLQFLSTKNSITYISIYTCDCNLLWLHWNFLKAILFVCPNVYTCNFNCNYAYICQTSNSPNFQMTTSKQYCVDFALVSASCPCFFQKNSKQNTIDKPALTFVPLEAKIIGICIFCISCLLCMMLFLKT